MRSAVVGLVCAGGFALALTAFGACSSSDGPGTVQQVSLETMRADAEAATDDMAQFLSQTIQYASIEPEGPQLLPETEALLEASLQKGRDLGFTARRSSNGLVGILEYGEGEEVVGALIHLDVVAPGELSEWDVPPFSGEIADGVVYGRGAQDDKAGLVGVLWGAKILIDNDMTFTRRLRVVLGTKEETTFEDMSTYFAEEAPPDFGIVPDAPYLVRAEAGYADLAYVFSGLAPAAGATGRDTAIYWKGGSAVNSVPDFSWVVFRSGDPEAARGEIQSVIDGVTTEFTRGDKVPVLTVVDWDTFAAQYDVSDAPQGDLVLYSRGVIAHSSIPDSGRNAVVEVALVGARLSNLSPNAFQRAFAFTDEKIGLSTDGSGFGLDTDKPIPEASNTTASLDLAITDQDDDRFELVINYRVGVANTTREIQDKSGAAAAEYAATLRTVGTVFDAYYYPDGDPLLELAKESYEEVQGHAPLVLSLGSTTYVKAAPNLISFGPIDLALDGLSVHAVNEKTPVAALTRNAVLYAHFLQKLIQIDEAPLRPSE